MDRRCSVLCAVFVLAGALLAFGTLLSCATRPPEPEPRGEVRIGPVRTEALDPYRVRFLFEVRAANPGPRTLPGLSLDCRLEAGGIPVGLAEVHGAGGAGSPAPEGPFSLAPGEERIWSFEGFADLKSLSKTDPAGGSGLDEVPWRITAVLSAPGPVGTPGPIGSARTEGSVPRVREPLLTIRSIVLVRHELVNVLLELVLDVENPNPFPVEFSAASYRFHGEGRIWASGRVDRPAFVPARGTAEVRLPILLNFTETGRDLFDLVAKLQVVRYRLEGQARVSAPLTFLPEFRMDFDRSGAVQVERNLPTRP